MNSGSYSENWFLATLEDLWCNTLNRRTNLKVLDYFRQPQYQPYSRVIMHLLVSTRPSVSALMYEYSHPLVSSRRSEWTDKWTLPNVISSNSDWIGSQMDYNPNKDLLVKWVLPEFKYIFIEGSGYAMLHPYVHDALHISSPRLMQDVLPPSRDIVRYAHHQGSHV